MKTTDALTLEHRGCHLAYRVHGEGAAVLLIQGVGVHGDGWLPQVEELGLHHRCLWFDNRGIGGSQPQGVPLTVAQMAEDAQALLDAQGWRSAHIVGHSLGGLIALHLAVTAPERVNSLALLCTFARGRVATQMSRWMLWVGLRTRLGPRRLRRHAFLELVVPPTSLVGADRDSMASQLMPFFGHDLADQPPVVMKQLAAMRAYDATPRLYELAGTPTLVVSATHDRIAPPAAGQALAAGIPGARYVEIPDASHGVTIQRADHINRLLLEHFASVSPRRTVG